MNMLVPLPVTAPLAIAGILLAGGHFLPRRAPDIIALATALAAFVICLLLARAAAAGPLAYWFGGWAPHGKFPLGIGFVVDQAGAGFAAFIALLFAATLIFAWGFFEDVHAHFHVLMLLFMAGMIGFCLTHDLFNMFVWFEVMSVAGFALTGYQLRTSALEGALNFTVTNTIGAYLILAGIGLIYAELGALDFSALQEGVASHPGNIVIHAAFALLCTGFLIKAAQVPFQFWLADAHAVAPSPVSVIFSGAMVTIGLFGIVKLFWLMFAPDPQIQAVTRHLFLALGCASALVGGLMAIAQRHLKRLLAFSTIAHAGIMLIGISLLSQNGLAGMFTYLIGHGLVKGAMFMVTGILLAECASIDEIGLRGLGREIWPAGVAMALGGLLLAGLPLGLIGKGSDFIDAAAHAAGLGFVPVVIVISAACTGGAVLRACGRIFLGLGPVAGEEDSAPTEDEQEKADRPLWLMLAPTVLLLALAVLSGDLAPIAAQAALRFMHPDNAALLAGTAPRLPASLTAAIPPSSPNAWISVALALVIATLSLSRSGARQKIAHGAGIVLRPLFRALEKLHSGLIGDYITWVAAGLALFVISFTL